MIFSPPRRFVVPLLLALSACAGGTGPYPSLAPRPVEQAVTSPTSPAADAPDAIDPAVLARATTLAAQAERGAAAVEAAMRGACAAVARGRGARAGSEPWVGAQQALSAVEAARSETMAAREAIDTIVLDQTRLAQDRPRPIDLTPLIAVADRVDTLDTGQQARFEAMRAGRCDG